MRRRRLRPFFARLPPAVIARAPDWAGRADLYDLLARHLREHPVEREAVTPSGARFLCDTRDVIERYVYLFGVWEPAVTATFHSILRPGGTFIDVGANIGYYSVLAARLVGPTGTVVAVEPLAEARGRLAANVALNSASNIRVIPNAVSDRHETLQMHRGPEGNLGRSSTHAAHDLVAAETVEGKPLTELVDRATLESASLLKIDVEGDEAKVLAHALDQIPSLSSHADILVELTPRYVALRGSTVDSLWTKIREAGFLAYAIPNPYDVAFYIAAGRTGSYRLARLEGAPESTCDLLLTAREVDTLEVPARVGYHPRG